MTSFDADTAHRTSEENQPGISGSGLQIQETFTAFHPFGPLSLFNYLTPLVERTNFYRAILRTFYQRSRAYRYQLTAQDVLDTIRKETRLEYHLEQCKADLDRLVQWGNLTTLYDTGRVTTIADLRSPVLRYQATSEALEIEAFLASHAHLGASEGGLRQGDLPLLDTLLRQLDAWLEEDRASLTPERLQEIADEWHRAFTIWGQFTHDAAQYLGSMHQSSQQITDRTLYLTYKGIVVTYIQSFAQQLIQYSHALRTLLLTWTPPRGKKERLLEILQSTHPPLQVQVEHLAIWHDDLRQQVEALQDWFLQESNLTLFSRAANDAIQKVVHRARTLVDSLRPQTDYVSMLSHLASWFTQVDDLETAQQMYAAAFASTTPIHFSEGFAGSPVVADTPGEHTPWLQPPTVVRSLRPIAKGNAERQIEQPMRHRQDASHALKRQHEAESHLHHQRLARLFSQPLLDLGMLPEITPDERDVLGEILDGCLSSPAQEHKLSDGSVVRLLNRQETSYVALRAADGVLTLPRYRLRRQTASGQQMQSERGENQGGTS
ncbi:MAG TPA: TIGR02677 family protein [Ktedonobacteraceae bacterium]|nr:TIGR02677 family protein [Ktedonobacteraceae bacterium]